MRGRTVEGGGRVRVLGVELVMLLVVVEGRVTAHFTAVCRRDCLLTPATPTVDVPPSQSATRREADLQQVSDGGRKNGKENRWIKYLQIESKIYNAEKILRTSHLIQYLKPM